MMDKAISELIIKKKNSEHRPIDRVNISELLCEVVIWQKCLSSVFNSGYKCNN